MSCYEPKKAFPLFTLIDNKYIKPVFTNSGKQSFYITDYEVDHLESFKGEWTKCFDDFVSDSAELVQKDFIEIPCGKCVGCRLDYARQWSARCMLEAKDHKSNYFLTLTYATEFLPKTEYISPITGEMYTAPTLCKSDWQDFIKALRQKLPDQKLRYFMCGEYGKNGTLRPHMHSIVFGLELSDLVFYGRSETGAILYSSKLLNDVWKKGFVIVGEVNEKSCGYVARYCVKKAFSDNSVYASSNLAPEFTLMSTHPGIGRNYLDKHPDILEYDCFYIPTLDGNMIVKAPRYFEKVIERDRPDYYKSYKRAKNKKKLNKAHKELKLSQTDKEYLEMLKTEEMLKEKQIKALQRNL